MAFKKGNKLAEGNINSGRKPKYDLEQEAKKLLEYSLREDCLSLECFTFDKDYCTEELPHFAKRNNVFAQALEKAKERIGKNREQGVSKGKLDRTCWGRTARVYSKPIKNEEEDEKDREMARKMAMLDYEYKLKRETITHIDPEVMDKYIRFMDQISSKQSKRSIDDINIKEDTKS